MSHIGKKRKIRPTIMVERAKKAECTYVPQFPSILYQKIG